MRFEIFSSRRDVEPFSSVNDHAADFSALADPIRNNRNERDLFVWRNPLENSRVPEGDIGEIKVSRDAVATGDVYNAVVAQRHSRSQTGVTQCERHIVAAIEMLVDQSSQIDV